MKIIIPAKPVARIDVSREQAKRNRAELENELAVWYSDIRAQGLQVQPLVRSRRGVRA